MDRDAIVARLQASEAELRSRGVTHAALFGSRAVGFTFYAAGLCDGPADVLDRKTLKPYVRAAATADALYAL